MKIGDYVRTDKGRIGKVVDIYPEYKDTYDEPVIDYGFDKDTEVNYYNDYDEIIKFSDELIDLIEENDYVNGKLVEWVGYKYYRENKDGKLEGIGEKIILFNSYTKDYIIGSGIKSIVTKEQFDIAVYKVVR